MHGVFCQAPESRYKMSHSPSLGHKQLQKWLDAGVVLPMYCLSSRMRQTRFRYHLVITGFSPGQKFLNA